MDNATRDQLGHQPGGGKWELSACPPPANCPLPYLRFTAMRCTVTVLVPEL